MTIRGRNKRILLAVLVTIAIVATLVIGALIIRWELDRNDSDHQEGIVRQIDDDNMFWTLQLM